MSRRQRLSYAGLMTVWLGSVAVFWRWWLSADHVVTLGRMLITSAVIGYALLLPGYFFFFLGRMRRPNPALVLPPGLSVTFATTFVPGAEGLDVLERTITAMRDQVGYPHDVWVLDEGDDPAVKALCRKIGAHHFSRKGIGKYQGQVWPFKSRTKAGNYNAWLDWIGEQGIEYDILLQMDTDHVPQSGYMMEMLRPFTDPKVAYVAAPSIISGNRDESWVVPARYEIEATLHGALQMGYNSGFAPLIIGSHSGFRVSALRSIGGFQQTLAEDHHNALRLNAGGYRGVFAPDAIAIGDGAACFADAMVQEYQWSRALTQILLNFFSRDSRTLPRRMWLQFFFAETWYPLFALTQLLGWLVPSVALFSGVPWVEISYVQFILIYSMSTFSALACVLWVRRQGWLRPGDSAVVTWRSALLMLARWPYVLRGVVEACLGRIAGQDFAFRVTPKGQAARRSLPLSLLMPYILFAVLSLTAVAYHLQTVPGGDDVDGYMYLALANAIAYIVFLIVVLIRDTVENKRTSGAASLELHRDHVVALVSVGVLALSCALVLPTATPRITAALLWQPIKPTVPQIELPREIITAKEPAIATEPSAAAPVPTSVPAAASTQSPAAQAVVRISQPFVGVYDPNNDTGDANFEAEMTFVQWKPGVEVEVAAQINHMLADRRLPFLTIEPWPWHIDGLDQPSLLTDIADGRYDPTIDAMARVVGSYSPQPVYIRFGHEMDLTGIYPWAQGDPAKYIAAYRHFVAEMRSHGATNVRWLWSPSGNAGSAAYYPGGDDVDVIGVTLLVNLPWESAAGYTTPRAFHQILDERYALTYEFNRPIMVAEMGVSLTTSQDEVQWLKDARRAMSDYQRLFGVIYFDDVNPPMTGVRELTDWRLIGDEKWALAAFPPEYPLWSGTPPK